MLNAPGMLYIIICHVNIIKLNATGMLYIIARHVNIIKLNTPEMLYIISCHVNNVTQATFSSMTRLLQSISAVQSRQDGHGHSP